MDKRILEIILRAKDEASAAVAGATGRISKSFDSATGASKIFAAGLVAAGLAIGGISLVGVNYAGQMESLQIALETVTGSADDAARAMATIRKTAQDSPFFETATLAQFVQVMAASGQEIDEAVSSALGFGDVAAAFGKGNAEMTRLGNTLSQVIGKGKADTVDFKELVNSGWVSVRKDTAAAMGVTMAQFEEMVSNGEVGYDQIRKAAEKFTGAADKQSNTWGAIVQRMQESFQNFVSSVVIDTGIFDALKAGLENVITFLDENGENIGNGIKNFILWSIDNWPILAGIIIGALVPAIISMALAFGAAALALAPYILAGAALGLLAKVILDNWGPITSFFFNMWSIITTTFNQGVAFLQSIPTAIGGVVNGIVGWFQALPGRIGAYFHDLFVIRIPFAIGFLTTYLPRVIPVLIDQIVAWFQALHGRIGAAFSALVSRVQEGMSQAGQRARDGANNLVDGVVSFVSSLPARVSGAISRIPGIVAGIFNAAKNSAVDAVNGLLNTITGVWNKILGIVDKVKGAFKAGQDAGNKLGLSGFADGTNFAPGGMAIVGERGPELVNLPRGSQVIPNHRLGDSSPSGINITINASISKDVDIDQLGQRLAWEMKVAGGI